MHQKTCFTRRTLLLGPLAAAAIPAQGQQKRALGLALYTLRDLLTDRPAQILRTAAGIGYTKVEIMRRQIVPLLPHLKAVGLEPVSTHFETPIITGNWQAWKDAEMPPVDERLTFDRVLEESRSAGISALVFNYLPPKERGDLDFYRGLADKLNAAASKCRSAGMSLWYHNHNFEFEQKPGGRPMDILLERLDKDLVLFEADLFWISMAGIDPAAFLRQNAGRVVAVHLKDRDRSAPVPRFDIASVPKEAYREVGGGALNFNEILQAAFRANVKHYFVEQDHSADPLSSIRHSYAALVKLGF